MAKKGNKKPIITSAQKAKHAIDEANRQRGLSSNTQTLPVDDTIKNQEVILFNGKSVESDNVTKPLTDKIETDLFREINEPHLPKVQGFTPNIMESEDLPITQIPTEITNDMKRIINQMARGDSVGIHFLAQDVSNDQLFYALREGIHRWDTPEPVVQRERS